MTVKSNPWTALLHEKRTKTAYNSGDVTWMSTCLTDGGAGSSVPPPCSQGDCPRCDAKTCNLIYRHGGDACVTAPVSIDELTMRLTAFQSRARPLYQASTYQWRLVSVPKTLRSRFLASHAAYSHFGYHRSIRCGAPNHWWPLVRAQS